MMTDIEKTIELLSQRVADAEQELGALRRSVRGNFPDAKDGVSVNDRLDALETPPTTNQDVSLTPYVVPSAAGEGLPQQIELPTVEIEWGIPTADPTSTPTATITLQPCDKDGVSYANAATVTVYIRDDRSEVNLAPRGWLKKVAYDAGPPEVPAVVGTILSFLRFPWWVGSEGSHVDGVLIGEGPGGGMFPVALSVTSGTSTDTGTASTKCGYEYDVKDAVTGEKLAGTGTDPAVAAVDPITGVHKWVRPTVGSR